MATDENVLEPATEMALEANGGANGGVEADTEAEAANGNDGLFRINPGGQVSVSPTTLCHIMPGLCCSLKV